MKRKVCVLTGTRAEYGLFSKLLRDIRLDPELELQIIATCAHLSPEFGLTFKEIENDGFNIDKKIEMLLSSDTPVGVSKSMGLAHIGFSEAIEELRPDMLMLLGDRFETFCAAATACIACIPIAHIHGGEITEGSVDDALRHAITKMSHLHFTSTETYRNRVIQLGERPEHVFNVGSLGVENLKDLNLITKNEIENRLGFKFAAHPIMVTFHPATLEYEQSEKQFECLLRAIDRLQDIQIIFTKSNADAGGRVINGMIDRYVSEHPSKAISFISMGHHLYFNTMRHVRVFMGNSSSGIIEAPSLKIPTVNIGDRQKGRIRSDSVIDCQCSESAIIQVYQKAVSPAFSQVVLKSKNPYEKENTSHSIMGIIKRVNLDTITKKVFNDLFRDSSLQAFTAERRGDL